MPRNVWLLMLAQAASMSATPIMVLLGGLVGAALAPSPELATAPIAIMVLGLASSVIPVGLLGRRYGRRRVFLLGSLVGALAGLLAAAGVYLNHFGLFCLGALLLGAAGAVVQQYRFAAMESVAPADAPRAASRVLLGGLVAAVLGPELALLGSSVIEGSYAGAFLLLSLIALCGGAILWGYRNDAQWQAAADSQQPEPERSFGELMSQPALWAALGAAAIGYGMMSLIMTATPLHMHHMEHHSLADTKWVIQSHIIAMYLPSFFSGLLVARFGHGAMMLLGLAAYGATIMMALSGSALLNYWTALVLLGIGWNLLFVAGTSLLPACYSGAEKFRVQMTNDFAVFGFQALASLGAGYLLSGLGWRVLLVACIPMIGLQLALLAAWKYSKSRVLPIANN
ncbi:MFS transporter [Shewanella sp. JM162201]|uniref:MFS transporter n=1 Tax=Shewanella jiangmenensis TaxID=2837387 RepID=A0ABS5V1J3_9GAMM|nr:MFS transporter [Shewanella jiangmenensis]MBT1444339.1 MFS transporter [Shewanella jiangmenensis]